MATAYPSVSVFLTHRFNQHERNASSETGLFVTEGEHERTKMSHTVALEKPESAQLKEAASGLKPGFASTRASRKRSQKASPPK